VDNDNTVSFEGRKPQIPAYEYRYHYVRTNVRAHRDVDGTLELFHEPRKLQSYDARRAGLGYLLGSKSRRASKPH
jgi:hypothetical protein